MDVPFLSRLQESNSDEHMPSEADIATLVSFLAPQRADRYSDWICVAFALMHRLNPANADGRLDVSALLGAPATVCLPVTQVHLDPL